MEKSLKSNKVFEGRILKVEVHEVELQNGKVASREVVRHQGAVGIVPICDNKLIMVKQYRFPLAEYLLEIPAGKIDPGEQPEKTAIRELREETGFAPVEMKLMTIFYSSPGFSDEKIYLYLADVKKNHEPDPDEDEFLEVEEIPFEDIIELITAGKIRDGKTIAAVLLAQELIRRRCNTDG